MADSIRPRAERTILESEIDEARDLLDEQSRLAKQATWHGWLMAAAGALTLADLFVSPPANWLFLSFAAIAASGAFVFRRRAIRRIDALERSLAGSTKALEQLSDA